jgi:hypothetical protein
MRDEHCTKLLQELAINKDMNPRFSLQAGILIYKSKLYIGKNADLRERIFHAFHSSVIGGHSGSRVTHHRLKNFYWPCLKQFRAQQVVECPICQVSKVEKVQYTGLLNPLPIPKIKWSDISIDFVEGLPKSK